MLLLVVASFLVMASAQTRPGVCSNFAKVWAAYPSDEVQADELLRGLGGGLTWMTNTCTIRTTIALRAMGLEAGEAGHSKWLDGQRRRYLIRVLEMNQFMRATFGPPRWVGGPGIPTNEVDEEGQKVYLHPTELQGKAGLIRYSDCGFSDASGHFDVFDGAKLKGHGYPHRCKKMEVWDLCNPVSQPNYDAFMRYMRQTNAYDTRSAPSPRAVSPPPPPAARNGRPAPTPSRADVKKAQELLNQLSSRLRNPQLNTGTPDGIAGRRTNAAVAAFRTLAGLPSTASFADILNSLERY